MAKLTCRHFNVTNYLKFNVPSYILKFLGFLKHFRKNSGNLGKIGHEEVFFGCLILQFIMEKPPEES